MNLNQYRFLDTRGMNDHTETFNAAVTYNSALAKARKFHSRMARDKILFESALKEFIAARAEFLSRPLTAQQRYKEQPISLPEQPA